MIKTKQEEELLILTSEFEKKSKEMNKIIEKISAKEKSIDTLRTDIQELNTLLVSLENELITILKKRQKLSKKLFGVNNVK